MVTISEIAPAPKVEIANLSLSYRQDGALVRILNDVSLRIDRHEAYGLVGESGCGKSTLAMALMHYLAENAVIEGGSIRFDSENIIGADERQLRALRGKRMAMVYQDPESSLNPLMPVGLQIAEVFEQHGKLKRKRALNAAARALERVQIPDVAHVMERYPHELSGGQQQRVVIAMALSTNPEFLILDEPTTGLDVTVEADVLDLVSKLRRETGTAILFISHNLAIVARMCERIGVLYAGRIIEEGPSQDVLSDPRHPYTRALLDCVPRAGMRKDINRLMPITGSLPPPGANAAGCIYANRCPLVIDRCRMSVPALERVGVGRLARCFRHADVAPRAQNVSVSQVSGAEMRWDADATDLLRVENVSKTYARGRRSVKAVVDVSLNLRRGEVLGLVGESGSGKSSLAKCVVGLIEITSGKMLLDGREITAKRFRNELSLRRKVQMIFQNPDSALNPRHSVRRILARTIRLLGGLKSRKVIDARMMELAKAVRFNPSLYDFRPAALSGGLKQRVAIARAFAGDAELVICDEPTSALDVSVQAAILNLLADIQAREQVSYLFISHDLNIVRYISDRIAVMYLGQIVDIGPATAVFSPPHHPYTEALVSAIPEINSKGPGKRIQLTGTMPSPSQPPNGCRFHTRCPRFLGPVCSTQAPPWQTDALGHSYRCHVMPSELKAMQQDAVSA